MKGGDRNGKEEGKEEGKERWEKEEKVNHFFKQKILSAMFKQDFLFLKNIFIQRYYNDT